jgi:hypothetical protein
MQQPIHSGFSGMPWEGHNAEFAAVWIGGTFSPRCQGYQGSVTRHTTTIDDGETEQRSVA